MRKLLSLVLACALLLSLAVFTAQAEEPAYDLQGNVVKIRLWDNVNPYAEDVAEVDKERWLPIYEGIKAKYNCNFEFYTTTTEWDDMPAEWIMSVASEQPSWHITNNLSSMWAMQLVANGALEDITVGLDSLNMPQAFKDAGAVGEGKYGYITGFPGTEFLVFNRGMIEEAGMEYDPGEMFEMGKWSYDDFFAYVTELQSKLPEGTYAFFIDPNYWGIFAPPANGEFTIRTDFTVGVATDAFIESFEFLQKLFNAGVVRPANVSDDGNPDYWGTPGATYDAGVEVVMTHRAGWQLGAANNNGLDWGMVPYPWGSNVTLGTEGDYTTLSKEYMGTYYDLGLTGSMQAGAYKDFPGLEKDYVIKALTNLCYDLFFDADQQADIAAMADPDYEAEIDLGAFQDERSAILNHWLKTRAFYNPIASINGAGIVTTSFGADGTPYQLHRIVITDNLSVRSTFEAAAVEIEADLRDAGYLK